MKRALLALLIVSLGAFAGFSSLAQSPPDGIHAPSGGARSTLQSIDVPAWPNAPFAATVSTTWVRNLDPGGTLTIQNRRAIARDTAGRIFQERRWLAAAGDPQENLLQRTEISDPRTHVIYNCLPSDHKCEIYSYYARTSPAPVIPAGPMADGKAFLTRELLGRDTVSGVETVGTRETTAFAAGAFENTQSVSIVKEFWYSPQLGINVVEKRQDPTEGTQNFVVSDLSLGEPDSRLFELPANFQVVDMRKSN